MQTPASKFKFLDKASYYTVQFCMVINLFPEKYCCSYTKRYHSLYSKANLSKFVVVATHSRTKLQFLMYATCSFENVIAEGVLPGVTGGMKLTKNSFPRVTPGIPRRRS